MPFLRPLEWIATALRAFREKPLPSTYATEVQPTVDLFGSHRMAELQYEEVLLAPLNDVEVLFSKVPADKVRFYLSMAFLHNSAPPGRVINAVRVVSFGGAFPSAPFGNPPMDSTDRAPAGYWFTERNFSVPPDGWAGARIDSLSLGTRIQLKGLFVDLDIGETVSTIS